MDRQHIFSLLDGAGIPYKAVFHAPVYSMTALDGIPELAQRRSRIAKNLFLKGDRYYLLVARGEGRADLRALGERLHSGRLRFASKRELSEVLGLGRGEVTPFGALGQNEKTVCVLFDDFFTGGEIGVHPCDNAATVFLRADDLFEFLAGRGVQVRRVSL